MMRYFKQIGCLFFILCVTACDQSAIKESQVIDVASAMSSLSELKASDYFSNVRYIPLETTDESIIGRGARIQLFGDKIVVTTSQKQCLLFDKETGRFLKAAGHVGNDPQGYQDVFCWIHEPTLTLRFTGWHNNWISFDKDGEYARNISVPVKVNNMSAIFDYLDEDTYVSYASGNPDNKQDSLYIFKENEVLAGIAVTDPDVQSFDVNDINDISVWKGEKAVEMFGPMAYKMVLFVHFKAADRASVSLPGITRFWHSKEKTFFKEVYNDTIYQIKDQSLHPFHVFDLGEYHWPYADRYDTKRDAILITEIMDSEDFMFFRFIRWLYDNEKRTLYNAIFSKETGKVTVNKLEEGLTDDWAGFLSFQPQFVSPQGEFAGLLHASEITGWLEDHPDKAGNLPDKFRQLKNLDEEDNPVVFILK